MAHFTENSFQIMSKSIYNSSERSERTLPILSSTLTLAFKRLAHPALSLTRARVCTQRPHPHPQPHTLQ